MLFRGAENAKYYIKPSKYEKISGEYFQSDGTIENQSGFAFRFGERIVAKILVYDDEVTAKTEALRDYLFGNLPEKVEVSEDERRSIKIQNAIAEMQQYLGNDYEQESGNLRTDLNEKGVEKMDCSEFVSRFLQKATNSATVPAFNTALMVSYIENESEYFEFIEGSDSEDHTDIKPGDIFLWRKEDGGHTGVVLSYDASTEYVKVIEAIGGGGASEETLSKTIEGYCTDCLRTSLYTRTGKALASHKGWKGYFRPKTN